MGTMADKQDNTLREFAEFCHDYYAGTYKEAPWGKWRYGYHYQVDTMLELFLARKRIVDTVVTTAASPDRKPSKTSQGASEQPQSGNEPLGKQVANHCGICGDGGHTAFECPNQVKVEISYEV